MKQIALALTSVVALSTVTITGCGSDPGPEKVAVNVKGPGEAPADDLFEVEGTRECTGTDEDNGCYSWVCTDTTCDASTVMFDESCCIVGRPLIIDGVARVADIEVRDDWATG
jgi:hypothetical protein